MWGLKERVIEDIKRIAFSNNIEKVYIFGSRARGDYREKSDIDLACTGGDYNNFYLNLEEEAWTLLSFDVVNLDSHVSADLMKSIISEGKVLYEKT